MSRRKAFSAQAYLRGGWDGLALGEYASAQR